MTDQEIIQGLIERDNRVTTKFFFEDCRPLFYSIINYVFDYEVEYDEFVNELYQYLMENDAQKLKNFQFRSSVYMWLKILAIRYFIKKRSLMIDDSSQETHYGGRDQKAAPESEISAEGDLERLFKAMPNQRYAYVIRKLIVEDMEPDQLAKEMNIMTANLYNIKKRAMEQLTRVALNDSKEYGKKRLYIR